MPKNSLLREAFLLAVNAINIPKRYYMSDPRTFTVKQCPPAYAQKSGASIASATSTRRDFFNSIGKIGDLEVLNSVGGGKVGSGLRTLASISNSIRVGQGSLPSSIGSSLESGANWVLETTGIAPTVVSTLQAFNPNVVNQAYGQAKNVFQTVKQGTFRSKDIPGVLQDFQNLERLTRSIFTPGNSDVYTALGHRCEASPYAIDMIKRAPKYKFLFIVQFVAAGGTNSGYGTLGAEGGPLDMAFVVKRTTRPVPRFTYEDVNYYNFRTKSLIKTEFEDMTMSFHDDQLNYASKFYHAYTRATIPITGRSPDQGNPSILEQMGMDFQGGSFVANEIAGSIPANTYAASSGLLFEDRKHIFKEIRVYHLHDYGHKMNVWRFLNPQITTIQLDDLDMSDGSNGTELSLSFNYDSVYLDPDVDLQSDVEYNIDMLQRGAFYPLRYNGPTSTQYASSGTANATGQSAALSALNTTTNAVRSVRSEVTKAVTNLSTVASNALNTFTI